MQPQHFGQQYVVVGDSIVFRERFLDMDGCIFIPHHIMAGDLAIEQDEEIAWLLF